MAVVLLSVVTDTVEHKDYLSRIQPYVPGCPSPTILEAVNQAITELCDKSLIWRETLTAFDLTLGEDTYTLALPPEMQAVMPIHVQVDGREVPPASEEDLDDIDYGWRVADNGTPTRYFSPEPGTIQFNRKADETFTDGIVVRMALKPTPVAETSSAMIYNHWQETIRRGALHYLMEMTEKEWSNPQQGMIHGRYFNSQVQSALARTNRGHVRQGTYARIRPISHHRRR